MTIRLRKEERERLVEMLEGEFDSPEAAASALFGFCYDLISKRDQVALQVRWGPGVIIGPFPGQVEAKKAGRLAASTFAPDAPEGAVRVIPLMSPTGLLEVPKGGKPGICLGCEHPKPSHWDKAWVKPGGKIRQPRGCVVAGCGCKEVFLVRKGVWVSVGEKATADED